MRRTTRWAWGLLAVSILLAGCKRVEDEKTVGLEPNNPAGLMEIPAQPKDMKVTVTATAPGASVTLYLVSSDQANQLMNDLEHHEDSKAIAKSNTGENVTLEGTAPANKDCTVVGLSDKKAQVKAHVVGRY